MLTIRPYNVADYSHVVQLYKDSSLYGGQYDDARDSEAQLAKLSASKPEAILVAETSTHDIVGTVTLFEDGRAAWLYRFAVARENETHIARALYDRARQICREKGHTQVLVYAPKDDEHFEERYRALGFTKGNDFTAFWMDI